MRFSSLAAVTISLTILCVQSAPTSLTDAPVAGAPNTFLRRRKEESAVARAIRETREEEERRQQAILDAEKAEAQRKVDIEAMKHVGKHGGTFDDALKGKDKTSFVPESGFDWKALRSARDVLIA
jgi:hypothetical protein